MPITSRPHAEGEKKNRRVGPRAKNNGEAEKEKRARRADDSIGRSLRTTAGYACFVR